MVSVWKCAWCNLRNTSKWGSLSFPLIAPYRAGTSPASMSASWPTSSVAPREAEVLVAVDGDSEAALGCVTFVPDASSAYAELLEGGEAGIRMLAVDPGAQRRGTGRALLAACTARAKELRRTALILHTTPWMTSAHRLYESSGFERLPDRDWAPVPEVHLMAYRLLLSG